MEIGLECWPGVDVAAAAVQHEGRARLTVGLLHLGTPSPRPVGRDGVARLGIHVHWVAGIVQEHGDHTHVIRAGAEDAHFRVGGTLDVADMGGTEGVLQAAVHPGHHHLALAGYPAPVKGQAVAHGAAHTDLRWPQRRDRSSNSLYGARNRSLRVGCFRSTEIFFLPGQVGKIIVEHEIAQGGS